MSEKAKAMLEGTKHQAWKWIGSLFMAPKTNAKGETELAASLTKVLTLGMFVALLVYWYVAPDRVPDSMVYTLWGMLGLKATHMVSGAIRAKPTP